MRCSRAHATHNLTPVRTGCGHNRAGWSSGAFGPVLEARVRTPRHRPSWTASRSFLRIGIIIPPRWSQRQSSLAFAYRTATQRTGGPPQFRPQAGPIRCCRSGCPPSVSFADYFALRLAALGLKTMPRIVLPLAASPSRFSANFCTSYIGAESKRRVLPDQYAEAVSVISACFHASAKRFAMSADSAALPWASSAAFRPYSAQPFSALRFRSSR